MLISRVRLIVAYEFFVLGGIFSYTVVLYAIIISNNRNINWTLYPPWKIKLFKRKLNNNQREDYQRTDLRIVNHTKYPKQAKSLRNTNFSPKIILNMLKSWYVIRELINSPHSLHQ